MLKTTIIVFICILSIAISATNLDAQRKRIQSKKITNIFSAGVVFGGNLSQIDGDFFTGFDKAGLSAGIKAYSHLTNQLNLNVEILYTTKGSKIPHGTTVNSNSVNDRIISLNYIEIPLLAQWLIQPDKYNTYLLLGPVFSRLVNTSISENDAADFKGTVYNEIVSEFNPSEISFLGGVGFSYKYIDISFRYTYGLSKFYSIPKPEQVSSLSTKTKEVYFLRNYHMGLMLTYKI